RSGQITPNVNAEHHVMSLSELGSRQNKLKVMRAKIKSQLAGLDKLQSSITAIDSRIAQVNGQLAANNQELAKRKVESKVSGRVQINQYAGVPGEPSNTSTRKKLAALGGIAGLSLGVGLIALVGLLDRRLRHAEDIQP